MVFIWYLLPPYSGVSDKSDTSVSLFSFQTQRRRDAKIFLEHGKHETNETSVSFVFSVSKKKHPIYLCDLGSKEKIDATLM